MGTLVVGVPGRASDSRTLQTVGAAVAFLAVAGSALAGWRFEGDGGIVQTTLAVACVLVAVGATLLWRR